MRSGLLFVHTKRHVDRFSRFYTSHRRVSHYFTIGRYGLHQKLLLPFGESSPHLTQYLGPTWVIDPNGIWISSAVFVGGPKCYAIQYIVSGEKVPLNVPFPLRLRHPTGGGPSHGNRQRAQKLVKIALVVQEISARTYRQTDGQTHTHIEKHTDKQTRLLQYFDTAPVGEVTACIQYTDNAQL